MSARLAPGVVLGDDFEIVRLLGEGGMGAVYEARQKSTGALRALKTMHADIVSSESARERFMQEARVAATIESEHVVNVLSAGIDAELGIPWIAMELLKGEDLAARLARGPLDLDAAREIFAQLGHALAAAHRAGIVHRDMKPANVFVSPGKSTTRTLTVKVLDFGIAKVLGASQATQTGAIGTPLWMAPEQTTRGADISARTDVWAIGLMAFYALAGKHYWLSARSEDSVMALLKEITIEPLEPASTRAKHFGASLPADFDAFFAKCVARDPAARFHDAAEAMIPLDALLVREIETKKSSPAHATPSPYAATAPLEDFEIEKTASAERAADASEARDGATNATNATNANANDSSDADDAKAARTDVAFGTTKAEPAPTKRSPLYYVGAAAAIAAVIVVVKYAPGRDGAPGAPASHSSSASPSTSPSSASSLSSPSPPSPASLSSPPSPPPSPVVRVTGDHFLIGNALGAADERPPTRVSVAGFEIDATEVTAAGYGSCVAAGECTAARKDAGCNYSRADRSDHPINCVTFAQASAYCKWAGKRLPSETEWEHAARGPKNTLYPWGDALPDGDRICWRRAAEAGDHGGTCAVKSAPRGDTASGISDMTGNVWEWTTGRYCPYSATSCTDERRVLRGGSWASDKAVSVTATVRQETFEDNQSAAIGFRCARSM